MRSVSGLVSVVALAAAAASANASVITSIGTWNVGSGQPQGNFLYDADPAFPGGHIELGQRTIFRQSVVNPFVISNSYQVFAGHQTAGQYGAPVTNTARNRWSFDYHIYYAGGVQNLDSLTMVITSPAGNTVAQVSYDMLVANNDNVTGSQPYPMGDSQDPTYFIQDSQNPVFAPWFVPTFDMNVEGVYSFTLTATEGASSISQTMYVNVLPSPSAAALLGLGGLTAMRRRRR